MRFKLDENVHRRVATILTEGGHDVSTVRDEAMGGASDARLAEACVAENRCLVTLDPDFANMAVYPPERYPGIIVLWLPGHLFRLQLALAEEVGSRVNDIPVAGRLWIVEPGHIRMVEPRRE